ncbi:MAG TPA: hypothetical protein VM012_10675 [Flavitalea sp.]|nr:hypothetical protein [Flavitalea sp.]
MVRYQKVLILFSLTVHLSYSQGVFTNETTAALQKVIQDYPNRFRNIRGALLTTYPETTDYQSIVEIPGAVNAVISQYHASNSERYSWKSTLYNAEEFTDAVQKYNDLFNQIRNTIIKVEGEKPFILNGKYETPTASRKTTTSVFYPFSAGAPLQQLKVELTLQHSVTEWKIVLSVYDNDASTREPQLTR